MNLNWADVITQITSKIPDASLLLLGAILTILGGLISDWRRERREKNARKEMVKAACRLVGLEFIRNQRLLRDFWKEAQGSTNRKSLVPEIEPARGIATTALSIWYDEEWIAHKSFLSSSLKQGELEQIYNFYSSFEELRIIHDELMRMEKVYQENLEARRQQLKNQWEQAEDQMKRFVPQFDREDWQNAAAFMKRRAPIMYEDIREKIEKLISMPNPLKY